MPAPCSCTSVCLPKNDTLRLPRSFPVPLWVPVRHPPRLRRISTARSAIAQTCGTPRLSPARGPPKDTEEPISAPQTHEIVDKPCSALFSLLQAAHTQAHKHTSPPKKRIRTLKDTKTSTKTEMSWSTQNIQSQNTLNTQKQHKQQNKNARFCLFRRFLLAPPWACCSLGTRHSSTRRTWGTAKVGTDPHRPGCG